MLHVNALRPLLLEGNAHFLVPSHFIRPCPLLFGHEGNRVIIIFGMVVNMILFFIMRT